MILYALSLYRSLYRTKERDDFPDCGKDKDEKNSF